MSRRASRLFVIVLVLAMLGVAAVTILSRQPQYRLPMRTDAQITDAFVLEKTAQVLRLHGLEPDEPLPNPTDPDGHFHAPWPDNPLYGYVLWRAHDPEHPGDAQTWRVQTKPLDDEFIGWPQRVDGD